MSRFLNLDWSHYLNTTVRVYRNLNNGKLSIQSKESGSWKVVGHVTDCVISQVSFKVGESGRQRVITRQVKNVHAWGEGVLIAQFDEAIEAPIQLKYDPYRNSTFVQRTTELPIVQCQTFVARANQVFVSPDALKVVPFTTRGRIQPSIVQPNLFWKPFTLSYVV